MTISTVGTLVNSSVTSSQSTVSLTTVNVGDLVVANVVVYGNISVTGISGGNTTWFGLYGPGYNSTLGVNAFQAKGQVTSAGTATITLTFGSSIGATKVQRTITQLTAGWGAATEWHWRSFVSQTNTASTTLTYPTGMPATVNSYYPYAANGGQATQTGLPFAYVGYALGGSTGSAGSTSGFGYTVDANGGVLATNTSVTQGTTPAPTASQASSTVSVAMGGVVTAALPGTPFLTQATSGLRAAVEIAWGANLTDLTAASWVWTDVTGDVLMDPSTSGNSIKVTLGTPNDTPGQQSQASEMTCTLLNAAGQYSLGGQSPNYPNVTRNVPIRLRIFASGTWYVEYQAGVVSFQPAWDVTGKWATVVITASGPLRQLNQGSLGATSYYAQTIPTSSLFSGLQYYWNNENGNGIEDPDGITLCYPTVPSGVIDPNDSRVLVPQTDYLPNTTATRNTTAFPIAGPLPSAWDFETFNGALPATTNTGSLQFRWLCAITSLPTGQTQPLLYWKTSASSSVLWQLNWTDTGNIYPSNSTGWTGGSVNFGANSKAWYLQLQHTTNGSGANIELDALSFDGTTGGFTWTGATGSTVGYLTFVNWVGPNINTSSTPVMQGHMTVQNATQSISTLATFYQGNPGEAVTDRLTRIANQANIPITILTDTVTETSDTFSNYTGSQFYDTVANLLRECEATNQGMLLDGLNPGLTYVTRLRRESQQPTLTIDASQGGLAFSFDPIDDDQNTVNTMTVSRRNGSSYTYQLLTGQRGANTIGVYSSSLTVNQQSDASLAHMAQWGVNLGTPSGYRFPKLQFSLEFNPSLIPSFLALIPSGRVDVTNITSIRSQMQNATIKNVALGWTETIDLFTWHVDMACTSADPWRVITLAAATGSTSDTTCWLDTDGSQLHAAASQGATSITVDVTSGPRWVTTADTGGSDNFPFYINLGGVQVQVTNVTGTSNPQTFAVAALPQAFAAGTAVSIWDPPVLGM